MYKSVRTFAVTPKKLPLAYNLLNMKTLKNVQIILNTWGFKQSSTNPFVLKWWNIVQNKVQTLSCPNRALCIKKLNENK